MKFQVTFHQLIQSIPKDQEQPIIVKCPNCKNRNHIGFIVNAIKCLGCKAELYNKEDV